MVDRDPTDNAGLPPGDEARRGPREDRAGTCSRATAASATTTRSRRRIRTSARTSRSASTIPTRRATTVKKAGLENVPVDFYASDVPGAGALAACQVVQQSAAAAGINLNLIQPPADTYWSSVWIQKPLSVHPAGTCGRFPDLIFSIAFRGGADWNETRYADERFDPSAARSALHRGLRQAQGDVLRHAAAGPRRSAATSPSRSATSSTPRRPTCGASSAHPSGPLGFYQFAQTVWIDS